MSDTGQSVTDAARDLGSRAGERIGEIADAVKPKLRGWLHAGTLPVAVLGGVVLVWFAPTTQARVGAIVYAVTATLLFAVSTCYHRGRWSPRTQVMLRRLDHASIFLLIAGSYTPLVLLAVSGVSRTVVLVTVWAGAAAGVVFRVVWIRAPRWLHTPLYLALGWAAVFVLPDLLRGAGSVVLTLVVAGGLCYSLGAVVYALRRPNPAPRWFGFHEIFHAFTVVGFATHYVAISMVTYRAG